jgi:hypothetical protein
MRSWRVPAICRGLVAFDRSIQLEKEGSEYATGSSSTRLRGALEALWMRRNFACTSKIESTIFTTQARSGERDLALHESYVVEISDNISPERGDRVSERGDRVYDVRSLQVWPGLIDIHLHLGDLFETSSAPIFESVADGVTVALSPGASNTFMAPSLLGAEVDRGVPVNIGVYLGGLNVITSTLR